MSDSALLGKIPIIVYSSQPTQCTGVISFLSSLFKDPAPAEGCPLHPVDKILDILKSIGAIHFERKYRFGINVKDPTFGEYPFMLFGHTFITRDHIIPFLIEIFESQSELSPEQKQLSEHTIHLCSKVLHKATTYHKHSSKKKGGIMEFLAKRKRHSSSGKFFAKTLGIANVLDAHSAAVSVFDELASKYALAPYMLFSEENEKTHLKAIADIIVYAYLKECIEFTPDVEAVKLLVSDPKYTDLRNFMVRFETDLNANRMLLVPSKLAADAMLERASKCIHRPMVDFPMGSRVVMKYEEREEETIGRRATKYGIWACTLAGITLLTLGYEQPSTTKTE